MELASYIRNNPVRAELIEDSRQYQFTGCLVPGYPELDVHAPEYWTSFWKTYTHLQNQP